MYKKIFGAVLLLCILIAPTANAISTKDLLKMVGSLQHEVASLRASQGAALYTSGVTSTSVYPSTTYTVSSPTTTTAVVSATVSSDLYVGVSTTTAVKTLQTNLNKLGYILTADGSFGQATFDAVSRFQSSNGLPVTGYVNTVTLNAISSAASKVTTAVATTSVSAPVSYVAPTAVTTYPAPTTINTTNTTAPATTYVGTTTTTTPTTNTTTAASTIACTNWKVTSGGPQGGTAWEKLRDFSKYPEIDQYRIQWAYGGWSAWYTPGVDDKDTKLNNDGSWRYMISYKQDHNWETRDCVDAKTTIPTSSTTGKVFMMGGASDQGVLNDVWSTKDMTNWVNDVKNKSTPMWDARGGHRTLFLNGKIYLISGQTNTGSQAEFWSSSDGVNWKQLPNFPWTSDPYEHTLSKSYAVYNGKIWALGGGNHDPAFGPYRRLNDVWSFDGIMWKKEASAPWSGREHAGAVEYNSKLWMAGGWVSTSPSGSVTDEVWSFDGSKWKQEASLPYALAFSGGQEPVAYQNKIWVFSDIPHTGNRVLSFDGSSWFSYLNAPWSTRSAHVDLVVNGLIYIFGGINQSDPTKNKLLNDVWSFDGLNWKQLANAPWVPRHWFDAVVVPESFSGTVNTKDSKEVTQNTTNGACATQKKGFYSFSNKLNPAGITVNPNSKDFHFATIGIKTGNQPLCLNQLQLSTDVDPNQKVSRVRIYSEKNVLLANIPASAFYNSTGTTDWYALVKLPLTLKANLETKLIIKADVLDSNSAVSGFLAFGLGGVSFDAPGADGANDFSFGNVFYLNNRP